MKRMFLLVLFLLSMSCSGFLHPYRSNFNEVARAAMSLGYDLAIQDVLMYGIPETMSDKNKMRDSTLDSVYCKLEIKE